MIYYIFALMIILIFIIKKLNIEFFNLGIPTGFGFVYKPNQCTPENDCYKGAYFRTQAYQNVCPPKYGGINKIPIQVQDDCLRTLGNYPKQKHKFICNVDKRLNRHCYWKPIH